MAGRVPDHREASYSMVESAVLREMILDAFADALTHGVPAALGGAVVQKRIRRSD